MTITADARRRHLTIWVSELLVFYTQARNHTGKNCMLDLLTAMQLATDDEVAEVTPKLAELLRAATVLLPVEGRA